MAETIEIEGVGKLVVEEDIYGRPKVLVLDDEYKFANAARGDLSTRGLDVDVANSVGKAGELIRDYRYDAVVVDDNLGEGSVPGRQWLRQNLARLEGAVVAMLTAAPVPNRDQEDLGKAGVRFARKAGPEQERLYADLAGLVPEIKKTERMRIVEFLQSLRTRRPLHSNPSAPAITRAVRELYIEWLSALPNQDDPIIWFGCENLSIRELTELVKAGTSHIGDEHVKMFVSHLHRLLEGKPSRNS